MSSDNDLLSVAEFGDVYDKTWLDDIMMGETHPLVSDRQELSDYQYEGGLDTYNINR